MAPLSEQEMNAHLAEESRVIYKYAKRYRNQVKQIFF
uniref:Plexin cytoplasmic RasGAP domain-containing protein n=1 Tax=Sinocyclocheilus grahami TaxID=75366 RepID=A0A672JWM1_SINGR